MVEYRKPYATADGYICALPYNTKQWRSFFTHMGREDMIEDARVNDPKLRSEKIGELYEIVAEVVKDWKTEDALLTLEKADVPHGRATPLSELQDDPHMKAVEFFKVYDHPTEGKIRLTDPPIKFSRTPSEIRILPSCLGEHSIEVLREVGFSTAEISEMVEEGVTIDGRPKADKAAAE